MSFFDGVPRIFTYYYGGMANSRSAEGMAMLKKSLLSIKTVDFLLFSLAILGPFF